MRIRDRIYLDHNATTPLDPRVLAEMIPCFRESFGNPHSTNHAFGWEASRILEDAAKRIGKLIGADSDEIVFTSGATEANNLALEGVSRLTDKRRIVVSPTDHKSTLEVAKSLKRRGFDVAMLAVDEAGRIDSDHCAALVDEDVLVVSVAVVNSEIGTIQDVARLAELVRARGAYLHLDAAQAPCAIETTRLAAHADLVSLSGHKIYGPKGIGALYVRRTLQPMLAPMIRGGGQQNNLRSGTVPVPLCVGFAAAADILLEEGNNERLRLSHLRDEFLRLLRDLPHSVGLNGPTAHRHPGNLNVRFEGFVADDLLAVMQPMLAASTGSACASGIPEPSYVLRALGLTHEQAASSLRFCLGRQTTQNDVQDAVLLIGEALCKLGSEAA